MGLDHSDVHVWTAVPEALTDREQLAKCAACLSLEERARHERFRFERHRHEFLVAHALVRAALSQYAPVAPGDWHFDIGERGRPEIAAGVCDAPLRFNLSHTRGLVVVGVCLERDIGVDVEHVRPRALSLQVADRYFSAPEVQALRALPDDQQRDRFFAYWTLKESYIKARGLGLAVPLDQFGFALDAGPGIDVWFDPRLEDDAGAWWFEGRRAGADHRLAVAVRSSGMPVALQVRSLPETAWP